MEFFRFRQLLCVETKFEQQQRQCQSEQQQQKQRLLCSLPQGFIRNNPGFYSRGLLILNIFHMQLQLFHHDDNGVILEDV